MTTTRTQEVGRLEDLQDLKLPVIEINGRKEIVVGIHQGPFNQGHIYTVVKKDESTVTIRRYEYRGDGTIFEKFATDWPSNKGIRAFKETFDFYDAKLRGEGLIGVFQ